MLNWFKTLSIKIFQHAEIELIINIFLKLILKINLITNTMSL